MKYVARLLLLSVVVCGITWAGAAFMRQRYIAMARADDRLIAAAQAESYRRFADGLKKSEADFKSGKITPIPKLETHVVQGLQLSSIRGAEAYRYGRIAGNAQLGFIGCAFLLMIFGVAAEARRQKESDAVDRKPAPDAGKLVGDLVLQRRIFTAATEQINGPKVEIDGARAVVVFRNLAFISSFASNPERSRTELPFTEILSLHEGSTKAQTYFTVRTTAGKVVLKDDLQPFEALGEILNDIGELNRTSPKSYATAVAREPVVHTPWYGWLILALALGGVVYLGWKFMYE